MAEYSLAHVGINAANKEEARKAAEMFYTLFGFAVKEGNSSIFAGSGIEVMKEPYKGTNGHIAIGTPDVAAAKAELEATRLYLRRRHRQVPRRTAPSMPSI